VANGLIEQNCVGMEGYISMRGKKRIYCILETTEASGKKKEIGREKRGKLY